MKTKSRALGASSLFALLITALTVQSQEVLWTVGLDDNGWPCPSASGGPDACFVQENWVVNPLPGSPYSESVDRMADNDYYFAGSYFYVIESNGVYDPVGYVDYDETAAERALVPGDNEMRYHFNLPADLKPTDLLSVTFDMLNLDESGGNARYGVSVYVNGVLVQPMIVITPAQLDRDYTTPPFTLESVNAVPGPDYDNIVTLKGKDFASEGGGNWMGIDYVRLNKESSEVPVPVFPWSVGSDDDGWPAGTGGGPNATFVNGNGTINALPGSATTADNDYYFAGVYDNVIAGNGTYTPVGLVRANEQDAEGGFSGGDTELRYHCNLPVTLQPGDLAAVTFDPLSLDPSVSEPSYGVEVYVNGVLVMPEVIIRKEQLNKPVTTPAFTLGSVNAQFGLGYDNIVTLRGISHSAEGGGNLLKLDFVRFKPMPQPPVLPWSVGQNDNDWPVGDGGGRYATFVQEAGTNPLPGNPNSPEQAGQADDDYYFAGIFENVIPGNGVYTPVGDVPANEEAVERAFAGTDNDLRFHFNLPAGLSPDTQLTFSFEPMNLQGDAPDPRYGAQVYVNGVKVMDEVVVRTENLNRTIFTPPFTLSQVNAAVGPGYDNVIHLKGINYNADGGGNWMGFDYFRLDPVLPPPFPLDCGRDDNGHGGGDGGGPNAFFVQEAGVNPLPGNPASGETHTQNDDDYYFAGDYTKVVQSVVDMYGEYEPVGKVLVNEYAAERAFAGSDNELRYHFNLPATLKPTDKLVVSFDALSLDESAANWDPRYGVEVYFNGVLVMPEVIIRRDQFDKDFITEPFTLQSVNAGVGPGWDNIVTLKGINYNADGGGNWMGLDYMSVDTLPQPTFPLAIGKDDDGWPMGDGGGENTSFVQETGNVNGLPGNPKSPERNQQADNDYYFAGVYNKAIDSNLDWYGAYEPAGIVPRNEEAAERAFAGADNDLRYHFNLPETLKPTDEVVVTFEPLNLHEAADVPNPRYGVEVYFNSVLVQPEIVVTPEMLGTPISTPKFTLASVKAEFGLGPDNIVSLRGINYSADGGGNWMGFDYVKIDFPSTEPLVFTECSVSNGKVTLKWTGTGILEWAPTVLGGWNAVTPAPTSPYTQDIAPGTQSRFYRLRKP
ncbi:MAG: hypothetical protein QHJ82_00535 [Verrucomicrobiota bacterium]|nr:hypothetical protein [Verrucomicrobiota bacterium]